MKRILSLLLAMALVLSLGGFVLPQRTGAPPKYDTWREAYTALITDEALRKNVIGKDADYRESYFSSDPTLLRPTAYAAADINADGTPELLLYAEGTGLTDLFAFDGTLRYLGYDRIFGFLPEEGLAVIHGHWHGSGGSGTEEYSARDFFRDGEQTAYLDCLDTGEELRYSFYEAEEGWSEGTGDRAAARYEELYDRYVRACVRMEDIPLFAMDNLSGFLSPTVVKYMRRLYNAVGTFPYAAEDFLRDKRWEGRGLDIREEEPLRVLRFDMDGDSVPELLLTNGCRKPEEQGSWIFRYNAADDRMLSIGPGPREAYVSGGALYGRGSDGSWTAYEKTLVGLRTRAVDEAEADCLEKYGAPEKLAWMKPEKLLEQIRKGE